MASTDAGNELTEWLLGAFDHLIERARLPASTVVAEATKRGLPVHGRTTIERVASLRTAPVTALDDLAASFIRSNAWLAAGQGFVTGLPGLPALPVTAPTDVAATLVWMARATSGVMQSFGFEAETEEGRAQLQVGMLAGAGIKRVSLEGSRVLVTSLGRRAATGASTDALARASATALASQAGASLARRGAARAVPLVGGVVGGGINHALVRVVGERARRHYRSL